MLFRSRINLAQSCNAVGWILGPIIGSTFILSKTEKVNTSNEALYLPYLLVAGVVTVLLAIFIVAPVPDLHAQAENETDAHQSQHERPLFKERHFVLAILSQFLYCAAQTGIFSFFINYVKDPAYMPPLPAWVADLLPGNMKYAHGNLWHMTEYGAGILLSVAFGFFTIGRFSGSAILRFATPHITLGFYALANVFMMLLVFLGLGWASVGALVLSFFFMSIMYPTHFALAIRGLGERTKLGASFMVTAIVGGSIMPILMGWLADHYSMRVGFLMPLACFVAIMCYGFFLEAVFRSRYEPGTNRNLSRIGGNALTGAESPSAVGVADVHCLLNTFNRQNPCESFHIDRIFGQHSCGKRFADSHVQIRKVAEGLKLRNGYGLCNSHEPECEIQLE